MSELADATNTELLLRIETAREPEREKAWEELIARNAKKDLHNLCFCEVVARAEDPYRTMAWELLAIRGSIAIDLCYIIKRTKDPNNPYQEVAWKLVCKLPHESGYCFYYLAEYAPQPYNERALEEYYGRGYPMKYFEDSLHYKHKTDFWKEKIAPLLKKKPG